MKQAAEVYPQITSPSAFSTSEFRLPDLQKTMLDATPDCIKVVSVDGILLTMNKAGCLALGVPLDSGFGMPWLPLLSADVHEMGAEALREATQGLNARFPGKSQSSEEIRYWDNLLTPLVDASGQVRSILCVSRDVTARIQLEKQLEEAIDREKLLSKEMQHRIKNLFSVVSGLISIAEKEAAADDARETATQILHGKLGSLARASDAAFGEDAYGKDGAVQADLEVLIKAVLSPYGGQCLATGDPATIHRDTLTTLALFLHELATNSIKYGALSGSEGKVAIRWTVRDQRLELNWSETGGPNIPAPPKHAGFGSLMVDRIVRSSGGSIEREWRLEGLFANLGLPNATLS